MTISARIAGLGALAALAATCAAGAAAQAPGAGLAATVPTRTDVRDLGRAPATLTVNLAVSLPYRNASQLDRLIESQGDRSSPLFGRFLSNGQFDAYFAPSSAAYAQAIATLRHDGFRVTQTFPNRTLLDISAPRAVVERVFSTEIHRVAQAGAGLRYANVRPALLPAELRGIVETVDGFNNLLIVRTMVRPHHGASQPEMAQPNIVLRGPGGGFGPLATSIGYDLPVEHGKDGSQRSTGNAICGDFQDTDLATFIAQFGIVRGGPATVRVAVDGGAPYFPPGHDPGNCSLESSLDVQTIVGNAPGTAFTEYLIPDLSDQHIEDLYNQVVSDNKVDVLNSSFGGCEADDPTFATATNKIAAQGSVKGITFSASSGDSGSFICGSGNGASAPASGIQFVAVGGTQLSVDANGNYLSETAWNGSTGGYSGVFKEPKYQKLVSGPLPNGRNTPDIAFASTNVAVYDGGGWGAVDGTSWSSPIYCALQTELDQIAKRRAGHIHGQLYRAAKLHGYPPYHDITTGSNGLYNAGPGYDEVTGIGSADGQALSAFIR
ncbi:MAG: S53 family peptidase [Candidatus Baltobacteraceae bacterium]